jgi:hypothetical protein
VTPEQILGDLLGDLLGWLAGLSWTLWVVVPVLFLAFALLYWIEGDERAASRRLAGGLGAFGVSVAAVLAGVGEGLASAGGGLAGVFAPHADFLGQLALIGAGWSGVSGGVMSNIRTFAVFALLVLLVSVVWGE